MRITQRLLVLITAVVFFISFAGNACATTSSLASWNQCNNYDLLTVDDETNSDVKSASVRVKTDPDSNQIIFLCLISYNKIDDFNESGVLIDFNDIGSIKVYINGTKEYDNNDFYTEIGSIVSDEYSKMLSFELTVGIKQGFPEELNASFTFFDTSGIASNQADLMLTDEINGTVDDESKETSSKTSKTKVAKTTKKKTTKKKTAKAKTTKNKSANKTNNYEDDIDTEDDEAVSVDLSDIETKNDKKFILVLSVIALVSCGVGAFAVYLINKKRNEGD